MYGAAPCSPPAAEGGSSGRTALHAAVAEFGSAGSVKLLLSKGYDKAWEQVRVLKDLKDLGTLRLLG